MKLVYNDFWCSGCGQTMDRDYFSCEHYGWDGEKIVSDANFRNYLEKRLGIDRFTKHHTQEICDSCMNGYSDDYDEVQSGK